MAGSRRPIFCRRRVKLIKGILQLFLEHDLGLAIWVSTKRILISFILAAAVAYPLGILMGSFTAIETLFNPIVGSAKIHAYFSVHSASYFMVRDFRIAKIAFLFLGVFVYLLPVVVSAVKSVPEELIQTARHSALQGSGNPNCDHPGVDAGDL